MNLPDYLILGRILKPRGLRGELKASIVFQHPDRLPAFKELYLGTGQEWSKVAVEKSAVQNGFWYLTLKGIDSIEQAERFRGSPVAVPAGELGDVPKNFFYHFQLKGLKVMDASGRELGTVKQVTNHEAVDYLSVEGEGLTTIPLSDSVIGKIDLERNTIDLKIEWE